MNRTTMLHDDGLDNRQPQSGSFTAIRMMARGINAVEAVKESGEMFGCYFDPCVLHAQMMKKMPGMVHKKANQINLAPGQRGGIVWQFAKAGTVTYACLVAGHKEAGMVGTTQVN